MSRTRSVWIVLGVLLIATAVDGADTNKALAETEGRRVAAEKSARTIKAKPEAERARGAYVQAAAQHNAWLDALCEAIEQGSATAPDPDSGKATAAAEALAAWVVVRNPLVGDPALGDSGVKLTKALVLKDLSEIATSTWKSKRGSDKPNRTKAADELRSRLKWKTWDEI